MSENVAPERSDVEGAEESAKVTKKGRWRKLRAVVVAIVATAIALPLGAHYYLRHQQLAAEEERLNLQGIYFLVADSEVKSKLREYDKPNGILTKHVQEPVWLFTLDQPFPGFPFYVVLNPDYIELEGNLGSLVYGWETPQDAIDAQEAANRRLRDLFENGYSKAFDEVLPESLKQPALEELGRLAEKDEASKATVDFMLNGIDASRANEIDYLQVKSFIYWAVREACEDPANADDVKCVAGYEEELLYYYRDE
ncbi:MAG: hypothetical protein QM705_05470 [Ancrocorticia sp.]